MHCIELDVCDVDAVMALPEALPADFADVSILVNNAGGALGTAKCTENDMNDMSTMIDANVKGLIACTRAFTPGDGGARRGPRDQHLLHRRDRGMFSLHWSPYDRVGVVNADP